MSPMAGVPLYAQFINLLAAILLLVAFAMLAQRRVLTLVQGRLVRDQPAGQTGRMAWLASS